MLAHMQVTGTWLLSISHVLLETRMIRLLGIFERVRDKYDGHVCHEAETPALSKKCA